MKTKAVVLVDPNKIELKDLEIPVLRQGQILVQVKYSSICGTILNQIAGYAAAEHIPHMLGHEGAGTVLECGPGVTKLKPGQNCVLTWYRCKGLDGGPTKYENVNSGQVSTLASHVVVSESRCLPLLGSYKLRYFDPLAGCALPTTFGILKKIGYLPPNLSMLINGIGGIGLPLAIIAQTNTYVRDESKKRIELAKSLNLKIDNPLKQYDIIIDTSGNTETISSLFSNKLVKTGTLLIVGNPSINVNINMYMWDIIFGKTLFGYCGDAITNLETLSFYLFTALSRVVTALETVSAIKKYKLDDINSAIEDMKSHIIVKPILVHD